MSVHFKKQCIPCSDVICKVTCETKRNKIQPFLVLQGFASSIRYEGDKVIIE